MHPQPHRGPSAALIVAMIALVAALAGTASALPGKRTVDKNDIKKGAVRSKAIKTGAVTGPKIKDGAVSTAKLADAALTTVKVAESAITSGKIADAAVGTAKLADAAVTQDKVAADAINSSKVQDESLNADDLGPGVISVVAYGKILNPDPGAPTIASGSVGLQSVAANGANDEGRTDVTVSPSVLGPTGSLAQCIAQATPAADPSPNGSLGFDSVTLAMGPPESATTVEAQTRGAGEVLNDFDYYLQVICPNV